MDAPVFACDRLFRVPQWCLYWYPLLRPPNSSARLPKSSATARRQGETRAANRNPGYAGIAGSALALHFLGQAQHPSMATADDLRAYFRLADQLIADARKDDLAEAARLLAAPSSQAPQTTNKKASSTPSL